MRENIRLTEVKKLVKSVQAQNQVVQQKLADLLEGLDMLDPKATIALRPGEAIPDGSTWTTHHSCFLKRRR